MADREKVIKALECRRDNLFGKNCEHCHYGTKIARRWGCNFVRLCGDALELLKAQEPRLVTKDDFANADHYGWLPAWCETKDDLYCECILIGALKEEGCRYWTSRPTDAQREAVKWDG